MGVRKPLKKRNPVLRTLAICICLSMVMTEVSFADSMTDMYWKENKGVIPTSQSNLQAAEFGPDESTQTSAYTVIGCNGDEEESQYEGGCDGYFTDNKKFIFGDWRVVKRAQTNASFVPGSSFLSGSPGAYEATYEYARDNAGRVYGSKATVDRLPNAPGLMMDILRYSLAYTTNLLGQVIGTVYLSSWLRIFGSQAYETLYNENGGLKSPTRQLVKDANGNWVLPSTLTNANLAKIASENIAAQSALRQSLSLINSNAQLMNSRQNKNDSTFFADWQSYNSVVAQIKSYQSSLSTFLTSFNNALKNDRLSNSSAFTANASTPSDTSLRSQFLNKSDKDLKDGSLSINTNSSPVNNTPIRTGELSVADVMDRGKVKVSFDVSNMDEVSVHGANIKDMASPTPRGPNVALSDVNLIMSPTDAADDSKASLSTRASHLDSRVALLGALNSDPKEQSTSSGSSVTMESYLNGSSPVSKTLDKLLQKNLRIVSIDAMRVKFNSDPLVSSDNGTHLSLSSYQWEELYTSTQGKHLPGVAA